MRIILSLFLCYFLFTSSIPVYATPQNEEEIVIVEVADKQLDTVLQHIKNHFPHVKVRQLYKEAFYGLSIKGSSKDIEEIQQLKNVKNVVPVATYKVDINESVPFIGIDEMREKIGNKYTGKGIKVGVIDTGIDYHHPDLRGNYIGGYDTIDNDKDPMETMKREGAPTIHGTHVAGIIAANGKMKGVAPHAKIIAYRALGPGGVGTSESVIAAIEKAIHDKVDIINLSLGNDVNGPDWPTSIALNRAVEKGIVAITASGNSGPTTWSIGSPGTASKAISVGASLPPIKIEYLKIDKHEMKVFQLQGTSKWVIKKKVKVVDGGLGKKEQLKRAKGKIVLIQRGEITFTEKVKNAKEAKAKGVIIYNNVDGLFMGKVEPTIDFPAISLSKKDGEWLLKKQRKALKMRTIYRQEKDRMADFSSRGPVTTTWEVKPDLVAPGVAIDSTVPGGYLSLQGTSMASPHVAGAAALLKEAHPDWKPIQIKAALMNTAKILKNQSGKRYHVYEQGAGRIQIFDAIDIKSLVYPSSLSFGVVSKKDKEVKKTVYVTIDNVISQKNHFLVRTDKKDNISWQYPKSFFIEKNKSGQIPIEITIAPNKLKKGMHEGYIYIEDLYDIKAIPYLFMVEEPTYPRAMGFQFRYEKQKYKYEVYLPQGAEELGVLLYEPTTMFFVGTMDYGKNIPRGIHRVKLTPQQLPKAGTYKVIVFAKNKGQENIIESMIKIGK
ncbi:MAG: S8 family serine peptidase [Bacillaceae bacterium]